MTHRVHTELGASSSSRWLACPGSVRLSRGLPRVSTSYSREGTAAHHVAEQCLRQRLHPSAFVGTAVVADDEAVEVTEEMAEAVEVFVSHCDALRATSTEYWIEQRFTLADLHPPAPMFGTADFVAYMAQEETLVVVDYKHGSGVPVDVVANSQLRYYALGALLSLGRGRPVRRVIMTIVQPRAQHPDGPIRSWTAAVMDLMDFAGELFEAARRTLDPAAPLHPGTHCRFCPAAGVCPAKREEAQALAQVEFETLPEYGPPPPETLPLDVLADMVAKFPILEDWMRAARALLQAKLERGEPVPGWKLVEKRKTRRWRDPETVQQWLEAQQWKPEEYLRVELKSPAQIERLVGKRNLPAEFIVAQSSGYTLARADDARPAVALLPGAEFALNEDGFTEFE